MYSIADLPLTGPRKAGVLMVALGADASTEVLKRLKPDEIERITSEIAQIKEVDPDTMREVVEEFHEMMETDEWVEPAGMDYARKLLESAMGSEKAEEVAGRIGSRRADRPFESIQPMDPVRLARVLCDEHPQTIALVLSNFPAHRAAVVLAGLPPGVQPDVANRIATMGSTQREIVGQVEQAVLHRISASGDNDGATINGTTRLVEILNQSDGAVERTVMEGLEETNPELAEAIKAQRFAFEDIATLDNRTIQTILREIEQEDLRLSLKGADETFCEAIFRNISERAAETLRDDLQLMGPVRLRDVEASQKRILEIVRRLEDSGAIVTRSGGDDELLV